MTLGPLPLALALALLPPVAVPDLDAQCYETLPPALCALLGFQEPAPPGHVHMTGSAFTPQSITIQVGETVTWDNHDGVVHTTTSTATPPVWNSGDVPGQGTFMFTFDQPGTYGYNCLYHAGFGMTGTIVVEA